MVTKDLASKLLDDRRFIKLGLDHNDLRNLTPPDGPISYADYATRIFDLYGQARGNVSSAKRPQATYGTYLPCIVSGPKRSSSTSSATGATFACL